MNDNQNDVFGTESQTVQTASKDGSGENNAYGATGGCCQKMMTACKDLCNRFMSARVGISYDITTRVIGGDGQGANTGNGSASQGQTQQGKNQGQGKNTMTKQGDMEIRMLDLTLGALMLGAAMAMICAVKEMCCCKSKCKRKC